jgi:tRNA(adenine34) deaminase
MTSGTDAIASTPEHERFMRVALEDAATGGAEGNDAVGSIVVHEGAVVSRGRNLVASTRDLTAHAETVALRNAPQTLGRLAFPGATLYTTFEPCPMCLGAIMNGGVSTLVLGARFANIQSRWGGYSVEKLLALTGWTDRVQIVTGVLVDQCLAVRNTWAARNQAKRP